MPVEADQTLLHYRLVEKIGEGGMGVVWKARDTTLDREVAIKILPEQLAQDSDRMARFEREARLLASLNHPNIAAIHGFHESGGHLFIAMELVDGEDLAERLRRGPLPLDEALQIAGRIAAALETAHGAGVIHRDLKPANVKVGEDDRVKVLDFGLAKAFEADPASASVSASLSPTITAAGTMAGMILGTASYMSPEQARGRAVDTRADIWAFGCVLYELLTGKQVFAGETVTDILAGVVKSEPDWNALPAGVPHTIRALLQRCLRKDPKRRLRDAADVRVQIEDAIAGETEPESVSMASTIAPAALPKRKFAPLPWMLATALAVALAAMWWLGPNTPPLPTTIFTVKLPDGLRTQEIAMAHDGRSLATIGLTRRGSTQIWVQTFDSPTARALPGTEGASYPFWSPDGKSIGFFVSGSMKRIDVASGTSRTIAPAPNGRGASWSSDGWILFAPEGRSPLYKVAASGGTPVQVTELDTTADETSHRRPNFIGNTHRFTYFAVDRDDDTGSVYLGSLDSDERSVLFHGRSEAYVSAGHLFHVQEGTLVAQRFDANSLTLSPEVLPLAHKIETSNPSWACSAFSVSHNGTLAYRGGWATEDHLVWFDRQGKQLSAVGNPGEYQDAERSPDGRRAIFQRSPQGGTKLSETWVIDVERNTLSQVHGDLGPPSFSRDGKSLLFASDRALVRRVLGSTVEPEILMPSFPTSDASAPTVPDVVVESPDGKSIVFTSWNSTSDWDLWFLPLDGESTPTRFTTELRGQESPVFSPDGRWVAYDSAESGQAEVYVKAFPEGDKWIVSSGGGQRPRWSADGKELFFLSRGATMMSVDIDTRDGFSTPAQHELFTLPVSQVESFSVAPDGERFLFSLPVDPERTPWITVVLNWTSRVKPPGNATE